VRSTSASVRREITWLFRFLWVTGRRSASSG
jgi:hypothetical protein